MDLLINKLLAAHNTIQGGIYKEIDSAHVDISIPQTNEVLPFSDAFFEFYEAVQVTNDLTSFIKNIQNILQSFNEDPIHVDTFSDGDGIKLIIKFLATNGISSIKDYLKTVFN
jgi:hypothetical protein